MPDVFSTGTRATHLRGWTNKQNACWTSFRWFTIFSGPPSRLSESLPPTVLGTLPCGDVSKGKGNSPLLHKIRDKESVESDLTLRGNPYVHERCPALPPAKQTRFSRQIHSRPTGPTRHVLALVAAFPCGGRGCLC